MKKYAATVLFVFIMLGFGVDVYPADIYITSEAPSVTYPNIRFDGEMPQILGMEDLQFQSEINGRILNIYEDFELLAVDNDAFRVKFDFEHVSYGNNHFIKIFASIAAAGESRHVQTIGFNVMEADYLFIEDFLGPNATALANDHITSHIRQNPGMFSSGFTGLTDNPRFFAVEGAVVFLFDQSEIAPARFGVTQIEMDSSRIRSVSFTIDEYITVTDFMVKMVPLREAVEGLGFFLEWNESDNSIIVTGGSFETLLEIGQNSFGQPGRLDPIELEAAPLLYDGITYVPVSFFDAVLGARRSTDSNGTITISVYSVK